MELVDVRDVSYIFEKLFFSGCLTDHNNVEIDIKHEFFSSFAHLANTFFWLQILVMIFSPISKVKDLIRWEK
jgi:hypothetical protein